MMPRFYEAKSANVSGKPRSLVFGLWRFVSRFPKVLDSTKPAGPKDL
jgi:hypothetical protein